MFVVVVVDAYVAVVVVLLQHVPLIGGVKLKQYSIILISVNT